MAGQVEPKLSPPGSTLLRLLADMADMAVSTGRAANRATQLPLMHTPTARRMALLRLPSVGAVAQHAKQTALAQVQDRREQRKQP